MNFVFDLSVFLQVCSAIGVLIAVAAYIWKSAGRHRDLQQRLKELEGSSGRVKELESYLARVDRLEQSAEHRKQDARMTLRGIVACLEGLKEQGCNGRVVTTLEEINDYILNSR